MNRNGEVLWRSDGLFDQTKSVNLRRAIGNTGHGLGRIRWSDRFHKNREIYGSRTINSESNRI